MVPANNIDPAKGLSAWALYNHPVKGHNGVLTANAKKNAQG